MIYVGNAFSLQMIENIDNMPLTEAVNVQVKNVGAHYGEILRSEVGMGKVKSVIGHQDLAGILHLPFNRESITLRKGDILYVAQVVGGRLPLGCTELPIGTKIVFLKVTIE